MTNVDDYPNSFAGKFRYKTFIGVEDNIAKYKDVIFVHYPSPPYIIEYEEARINILTGIIQFYNNGEIVENIYSNI